MNARPQLKLGWYSFVVRGAASKSISQGKKNPGSYMLTLTCAPTDADGDPKSPTMRHNLFLPIPNPQVEGHTAPNTGGLCHAYLRAVDPENFPRYPRFDKNVGSWVDQATGEAITKQQAEDLKREIANKVLKEMTARWADPEKFNNDVFYAAVVQNGEYRNVDKISGEAPIDVEVLTEDFVDYDAE